ncbi:MAG: hypothetical protein RR048_00570 [Oscillospiraceae bacterium]
MKNLFKQLFLKNKYKCKIYKKDNRCIFFAVDNKDDINDYVNWLSTENNDEYKILNGNSNDILKVDKDDIEEFVYHKASIFNILLSRESDLQFPLKHMFRFILSIIILFFVMSIAYVPEMTVQNILTCLNFSMSAAIKTIILFFIPLSIGITLHSFQYFDTAIVYKRNAESVISQLWIFFYSTLMLTVLKMLVEPFGQFAKNVIAFILNI